MKVRIDGLRSRIEGLEVVVHGLVPLIGSHRRPKDDCRISAAGYTAATAATICGFALLVSAVVAAFDDPVEAGVLLIMAVGVYLAGIIGRLRLAFPETIQSGQLITTVLLTWLAMISISSIVYLLTGAIDSPERAVFESFAGFTTTAHTALPDIERLGDGALFWRASTQWIGGFSALLTMVIVLPFLGVGAPRPGAQAKTTRTSQVMTLRTRRMIRGMLAVYVGLTVVGALLYLIGGMGPFDALTHALTTISTGGMTNHPGSFAFFDSATLEWIAISGMILAGANFVVLWTALQGRFQRLRDSIELRVYLGLIGVGSAIIAVGEPGPLNTEVVRRAVFSVASAASTTGFTVTDWNGWETGSQAILLVAIGIGSMSGSTGGGFRIVRLMVLAGAIRRELDRQLQPRRVESIRTGHAVVDPVVVNRMISHMVLYILGAAFGAALLALTGVGLLAALTGAVSALSTVGPAFDELGPVLSQSDGSSPGRPVAEMSGATRAVLAFLMLSGRLAFYPVIGGLAGLGGGVGRQVGSARASVARRGR